MIPRDPDTFESAMSALTVAVSCLQSIPLQPEQVERVRQQAERLNQVIKREEEQGQE